MLCLKKRRTYSFTQGVCSDLPRRSSKDNHDYEESLNMAITTLPRKNRNREERPSRMVLTVTEDTPADMLAGSMELLVQLPRDHQHQTQRVTVQRSTPMMDLLVQIATAQKLTASSYTLQAIGDRGMVLPHQPNTPIGALDALQVKLLPKQGTFVPRKAKQANQPFETTFRLQVRLPRNQLYVSRVSPKTNLGDILEEVCREKNLDKTKYELRHPANLEESLDLSLSLQDYHLQEVTLYAKQGRTLGSALSSQDIMALQRQEERRRQQAKQSVFSFVFKKSKEGSLSTDSLGGRSASPARSDETGRSTSPLQPPTRPQRKRRPAPKPPTQAQPDVSNGSEENTEDSNKDKMMISHSRNSSDSSGYHEASVLSDNPDTAGRFPETLPRRSRMPTETPRKLAQTSQSSKSLSNLASVTGTLSRGISCTSLSSAALRKKRTAPPPPVTRPLSSAISTQALERIVDSEESLTSDMDPSKPPSDISAPSKASSDIDERPKASSDIGVATAATKSSPIMDFARPESIDRDDELKARNLDAEPRHKSDSISVKLPNDESGTVEDAPVDARVPRKRVGDSVPLPKPRKTSANGIILVRPQVPKRKLAPPSALSRTLSSDSNKVDGLSNAPTHIRAENPEGESEDTADVSSYSTSEDQACVIPKMKLGETSYDYNAVAAQETETDSSENIRTTEEPSADEVQDGNQSTKFSARDPSVQEKKLCAVISTMPKCEHLDVLTEDKRRSSPNVERGGNCPEKETTRSSDFKRSKISRTVSKLNDFETNTLERQKRHLTSHAEDITFALNLNVASAVGFQPKEEQDTGSQRVGGGKSHHGLGVAEAKLSETDVLLQKVSNTLYNSLSVSCDEQRQSNDEPVKNSETVDTSKETDRHGIKESMSSQSLKQQGNDFPDSTIVNTNTPNLTVNSQQDTSDYVSAADEDLSIAEWEYQLPAPPSAFRDSASPVFDNFEEDETGRSPEIVKKGEVSNRHLKNSLEKSLEKQGPRKISEERETLNRDVAGEKDQKNSFKQQRLESDLKKEVINELENKIGMSPQSVKEVESKRVTENSSTPKIAPIDNTLSNFTITTYSRQKSLNIFEENQHQFHGKGTDDRYIRSFATLSRSKNNSDEPENRNTNNFSAGTLQGKRKVNASEDDDKSFKPKIQPESLQKCQTGNERNNIQRSKSYVSVCEKSKFESKIPEDEGVRNDRHEEAQGDGIKKATSIANLNVIAPKSNEKFSQWRENILKRQEEPTKEKQLQSLQVLKSILPQLKNAQQAEENVPKESDETVLLQKTKSEAAINEHSIESNVISDRDTKTASSCVKSEPEDKKSLTETSTKRYIYSPPAVSFGSWSERPSVSVQIKMDRDYKLGINKVNSKTIVNINGTKDERDNLTSHKDSIKPRKSVDENSTVEYEIESLIPEKKEPNELAKKLITHTTASGFKRTVSVTSESKTTNEKPVVTGIELKKNFSDYKQENDVIDTSPVNFKELSKAFGQDVCLRSKPKRFTLNGHSDFQAEKNSNKQTEHVDPGKVNSFKDQCLANGNQESKPKKFTSIVGIHSQNQGNFAFKNGINIQRSQPAPAVKGFQISTTKIDQNQNTKELLNRVFKETPNNVPQPPRPPTMPVITGVTLKTARPKSMPAQMDSRDVLLESIRNFGGRGNLKNAAERC